MKNEREALLDLTNEANALEVQSEEMVGLGSKMHEVYATVIKKYLSTPAVIQFIYLEDLRKRCENVKTVDEFSTIVESDLNAMAERSHKNNGFTKTEEIEYRIAKKVYKDVVLGKGKDFKYGKLEFEYDDQKITFAGFIKNE